MADVIFSNNAGNLAVGKKNPEGKVDVEGTIIGKVLISNPQGTSAGETGELRLRELSTNGSNSVGFKSPDILSADSIWILPSADGTSGQVLSTNGSKVLSWLTPSGGGTPGGANTNVQYNNAGAFGGDSDFTYDSTNDRILLVSPSSVSSASRTVFAGGQNNTIQASADNSVILGGQRGVARHQSASVTGYDRFSADGDAQRAVYGLRIQTTNATPTDMTIDGAAASATTRLTIPNNAQWAFEISVVCGDTATVNAGAWFFRGLVKKSTTSGSVLIVGTTEKVAFKDIAGWDVTVTSDTTNGALRVQVTGAAATTINWVATVSTSEVIA